MSILKYIYELRKRFAIKMGLVGIILILISLLANDIFIGQINIPSFIITLIGKIGEVIFIAGFIAFALEQHSISLLERDLSKSIISEIIDKHFPRKELIKFMLNCIRNLNKYENIDSEIYSIYEKHGLLELANEPRREQLSVIFKNEGNIKDEPDKILLKKIYDYRARNEANEQGRNKRVNENGLIAFFDETLSEVKEYNKDEILAIINEKFKVDFTFTTSFEMAYINKKIEQEKIEPIFISKNDFDRDNCRPMKYSKNEDKPELYGVYEIFRKNDGNMVLKYNLFFNVEIPPGKYIDLWMQVKGVESNYDLWTYEFISWTQGVTFELQLGDEFETKIEDVLIGVETIPNKSNTRLKYNGWIMPHSSISVCWKKK